jgi:hypothetical protein
MTETDEAADLAREDERVATPDQLETIKRLATAARVTEAKLREARQVVKDLEKKLDKILSRDLPEIMDQAGVPVLTVAAMGNMSGYTVQVKTMYSANIAAGWDQERRRAAFDWLETHGHGSLIKTDVITTFSREDREQVSGFVKVLDQEGLTFNVKETVPFQTLTAWLKEMVQSGNTPPLDTIGGYIERQAVIKDE